MSDLISRQAALDIVFDFAEAPHNMYQKIRELPTIEPKRGRWIKDGETYALYKCSVCNDFCPAVGYADCIPEERMYKTMKYCPNCGARMERSEE